MNEIIISLDAINPIDFLGANNQQLIYIKDKFPNIRILSRGTQLKLTGASEEILNLKQKIDYAITQLSKNQMLSNEEFIEIFHQSSSSQQLHNNSEAPLPTQGNNYTLLLKPDKKPVTARTIGQQHMVDLSGKNDILFAIGPAGSGKTYTAVALAMRKLKQKEVRKIILTRPAVVAGESLGYLPGDLKEKIDPYLRPLYDSLEDMLPLEKVSQYINNKIIEIAPIAYMRGRTLDNAFLILDEAQNATASQLKMFLTRIGHTTKVIITGDLSQIDLPKNQKSGLKHTIEKLANIKGIATVKLDNSDILRHRLVGEILNAFGTE